MMKVGAESNSSGERVGPAAPHARADHPGIRADGQRLAEGRVQRGADAVIAGPNHTMREEHALILGGVLPGFGLEYAVKQAVGGQRHAVGDEGLRGREALLEECVSLRRPLPHPNNPRVCSGHCVIVSNSLLDQLATDLHQ
eukprot:1314726-Pyramimonas_sp.AAC.1